MMTYFLLFFLLGLVSSAPTQSTGLPLLDCNGTTSKNIILDTDFHIPLSTMLDTQFCSLNFQVPDGYYALATVYATGLNSDLGQDVFLTDNKKIYTRHDSTPTKVDVTQPYMSGFSIIAYSGLSSIVNTPLQITITVKKTKLTLGKKVIQSMVVDTNSPSLVIYFQDLKQGETYIATSVAGNVSFNFGNVPPYDPLYNNVFIFDDGKFIGTPLYKSLNVLISQSRKMQIYVAYSLQGVNHGAMILTDYSNIPPDCFASCLSINYFLPEKNITGEIAASTEIFPVTYITDKTNQIEIVSTQIFAGSPTDFTFYPGTPRLSHEKDIPMDSAHLPAIVGNIVTIYQQHGVTIQSFNVFPRIN